MKLKKAIFHRSIMAKHEGNKRHYCIYSTHNKPGLSWVEHLGGKLALRNDREADSRGKRIPSGEGQQVTFQYPPTSIGKERVGCAKDKLVLPRVGM